MVGISFRSVGLSLTLLISGSVGVVAGPASVDAAFSCGGTGPTYDVRSGDSWYWIADQAGITVSSLLDANDAALDARLVVGDRLCLPTGADVATTCSSYTVAPGDSWASIGFRAGSSAGRVAAANGTDVRRTIHPGDVICLPAGSSVSTTSSSTTSSSGGASYTVQRGDSWAAIAARADVSMRALLAANDARSSDLIVPGDVMRLPAGAKQPPARPAVVLEAAATQGPCGYGDTWGHARSGGRRHLGVDIFPGVGNYVYAVVDGTLTGRLWDGAGRNGGNAWTLTDADNTRFFYAHLLDFAPDLRVGSRVQAGQIIGWVGSTGNSSAPHLHLEIRPGGGEPVNPYPIVRAQGAGCNDGRPYTQPGGWVPDRKY